MCDNVHSINVYKHSILHLTDSPIVGQEGLVAKPKPMRARTVGKNFQLFFHLHNTPCTPQNFA